jgi:hypothetical protein
MALKLEVGKKYRTRDGQKVYEVFKKNSDSRWHRFHCKPEGQWIGWGENGHLLSTGDELAEDLVAEVLTLQPGRYYRTRDGRKAYVAANVQNPFNATKYPVAGYLDEDDSDHSPAAWTADGLFVDGDELAEDLVEEWRDPPKQFTRIVAALRGVSGLEWCATFQSEGELKQEAIGKTVLAKTTITLTEGDGM